MEKTIIENHKRYLERINLYKSFGYGIEEERRFILEKAQPIHGNILEVGTGKGYFTLELAKEGYIFTSVDISAEEQAIAKLNLKYFDLEKFVNFKVENAENLNFEAKSFDIIFSINTIHHLKNPYKVLDELIRVLTFEGKIILSDFTKQGLDIMGKIHTAEKRKHEVGKITLADIEVYLRNKGFRVEKTRSKIQEVLIAYYQIR